MKKLITMLLRHWTKTPVKISLTILAVALGTGILILSFSAGSIIENEINSIMSSDGIVLQVANGEWGDDGQIEQERPTQWDRTIVEKLVSDSSTVTNAALILNMPIDYLTINGISYQVRNSLGTDTSYLNVYSLDIVAGLEMTDEDYNTGLKKVWISEETAETLFGSADNALGQKISPPAFRRGRDQDDYAVSYYSVEGVYETPSEVARRAYSIADVIFPVTSMMPSNSGGKNMLDFMAGNLVIKSESTSIEKVTADINNVVATNYGDDINVTVWEGNPRGESTYMEELRQTVSIFSISVKILGIVLLLTSSLGIFSIMVVEALGRRREIAIERALGASRIQVIKEFWLWSVMLSFVGAIIGIILSVALSSTVLGTMSPLISELTGASIVNTSVKPFAVLSGVGLALMCGGLLGVLPSFSAVKGDISDVLREA
ncbi:ABC transporter permease [Thiospirochaeta perfilievii]|uniref:ABC transporter permease n=1 Tax=Thiospirochaeta perfilievii TaxID=252967 RepID=A0A5C1Q7I4_9SPIO|nr:ABC transporter permease [Thiospirochaeta perfilievii]QEN03391.1 ABC transporter permease [Thiospirochaeta perfilievii]